jgi:hypothetical protein
MEAWEEAALADIATLKRHHAARHQWVPSVAHRDGNVDLFVAISGRRTPGKRYVLRLRYGSGWMLAGRREDFVDPEDLTRSGRDFWPAESIRGINPNQSPVPAICLRGVYGYHSVLHPNEPGEGTSLMRFLVELQQVFDE